MFIFGKLSRSCTLSDIPEFNGGDIYINQDGGFRGELSDLMYVNKAMGTTEIYNIYLAGNDRFTLYDKLADMTPKVNLKMDVQVGVNTGDNAVPVEARNYQSLINLIFKYNYKKKNLYLYIIYGLLK